MYVSMQMSKFTYTNNMDVPNDHQKRAVNLHNRSGKTATKRKGSDGKSLKVVYISSPMKVKTSASRFRSLVQRLTGVDSDVAQYMEEANNVNKIDDGCGGHHGFHEIDCDEEKDDKPLIVGKESASTTTTTTTTTTTITTTTSTDHECCHGASSLAMGASEETTPATSDSWLPEPKMDGEIEFATEAFPAGWFYSAGGYYPFEMDMLGNYAW